MLQLNIWDKHQRKKWNFMNVYGSAQDEHKNEFLAELANFCGTNKDPFLVGGDYNIIRFANEKNKGGGVRRHSGLFNSIIDSEELIDIRMTGGNFIWSNNQEIPTLEKLDRCLISKDWEDIFPKVMVYKLHRGVSDHNPLILTTCSDQSLGKLSFRFESSWLKHPDFIPTVKTIWEKPCHADSVVGRIQSKLKRFKQFQGLGFQYFR